jgi:hypothetical protein
LNESENKCKHGKRKGYCDKCDWEYFVAEELHQEALNEKRWEERKCKGQSEETYGNRVQDWVK